MAQQPQAQAQAQPRHPHPNDDPFELRDLIDRQARLITAQAMTISRQAELIEHLSGDDHEHTN